MPSLTFEAAVIQLDAAKKEATFYIMNTSRNRKNWGVTSKALAEGAPTIKGKPIGSGKGYKIDKHYPAGENMDLGNFTSYEIPSSYMTAKAHIEDSTAWSKLESKDWGPISVVCDAFEVNCSNCGEDILSEMYDHEHVASGKAYLKVESFKFVRVDFVDVPAYPQAGILDMGASVEDITSAITLMANFYQGSHSNGGDPGIPNSRRRSGKKLTNKTPEELQAELDEKLKQFETLETKFTELDNKYKTLKAATDKTGDDDDKDPELEKVRDRLKNLEAQRSQQLIDQAAEARFKAGLVEDLEKERERLADFPQVYLLSLIADAGIVEEKLKVTKRRAPKTEYDSGDELTGFDAAFKTAKDRIIPENIHKMLVAQVAEATLEAN